MITKYRVSMCLSWNYYDIQIKGAYKSKMDINSNFGNSKSYEKSKKVLLYKTWGC